jgi:two-component system NtrC family sensor kinase
MYALLLAATGITCFLTGLFLYPKKKPDPVLKILSWILFGACLWNLEMAGLIVASDPPFAQLWGRIFRNGLLFLPPLLFHFTVLFIRPSKLGQPVSTILLVLYGCSVFFAVFNWSPHFVQEVVLSPQGYRIEMGPLYPLFMVQFGAALFFSISFLIRGFGRADRYQRHRMKYFFLAIAVSLCWATLNFSPFRGLEEYPFHSITFTVGLFIIAYAAFRHPFTEISVLTVNALTYLFTLVLVIIPIALILLFLKKFFIPDFHLPLTFLLVVFMGVLLAITFQPIQSPVHRAMRQILVRDKYAYHKILAEFGRHLLALTELDRLLQKFGETLGKHMGTESMAIFLGDGEKDHFGLAWMQGAELEDLSALTFHAQDPGLILLAKKKTPMLRVDWEQAIEGMASSEVAQQLRPAKLEILVPLIDWDRLIGLILIGPRRGGMMYFEQDLQLLDSLAGQLTIAIANAKIYENLKKSHLIMRRADRLASVGTLIASLAHEIRNPLVSIKTFTQLLPERLDDEEFRNYFQKVASGEIDRLTSLINELIGFARPAEPDLKEEDLHSLLDKIERLLATEARKKNIQITKEYAPQLPRILVDAEQMKQVFFNVLLNAIQAIGSEAGGQIRIRTRMAQISREEDIESFIAIEIQDNGRGIPKENLERVFDPFFSTLPEGSGLGMTISHQIVHEHGGFIDLESEFGKGTLIRIFLPVKG